MISIYHSDLAAINSMAFHQVWLHAEQLNLVPLFLQTIAMLSSQDKVYMADFGIALLRECCLQARKLTDNFQEMLDLKRAEVFLATFRGCIVRGSSTDIPLAVLKETECEKRRFRDLVAAESYTVPRLQHLASDLRLALHYMDEWETNWRCSEALASVMEHVEAILDNLRLKILGLLHEPEGEYNPEFDFDFK